MEDVKGKHSFVSNPLEDMEHSHFDMANPIVIDFMSSGGPEGLGKILKCSPEERITRLSNLLNRFTSIKTASQRNILRYSYMALQNFIDKNNSAEEMNKNTQSIYTNDLVYVICKIFLFVVLGIIYVLYFKNTENMKNVLLDAKNNIVEKIKAVKNKAVEVKVPELKAEVKSENKPSENKPAENKPLEVKANTNKKPVA